QLLVDGSEPTIENIARGFAAMPLPAREGHYSTGQQVFEVRTEYNPEKRTAVQIVPTLIGVILTMTMTMFTAMAIVRERERGNLELLITTPASSLELMLGKLVPYVFIGLIQATLVLVLGVLLFNVPINGSLFAFYTAALLFIAATLTLGLIASTLAETQIQAFQMSIFVLLPSILLSGFVFPFDGMPPAARWIAQLLPLTHFVELVRGIVLRGAGLAELQVPIYKLLAFTAVTLTVVTLRFHKRLD
ncbi:MAG TPA: ABC transporter permease, partial [Steroidobacteraceae bacterium]|nr:ABC transporter permease [Steroidobacteraceae bacterium]